MDKHDFIDNISPEIIEEYYEKYRNNSQELDPQWQMFFSGYEFGLKDYTIKNTDRQAYSLNDEFNVINLIDAYRKRGHYFTKTNPVRTPREFKPNLSLENFDLSKEHLNKEYEAGKLIGIGKDKLSKIIEHLEKTYCTTFGVEYMYIRNIEIVDWLQQKMESTGNMPNISDEEKLNIMRHLYKGVKFEKFLHTKFPGHKRFSLEGCEALIPAMHKIIEKALEYEVRDISIGMAHRGRLNVMANVLEKPYKEIFSDFYGNEYADETVIGDVKYHLGYSKQIKYKDKELNLFLMPNPSHLEAVSSVVEGFVRARIDTIYQRDCSKAIPIVIHGDAAIAGQGIVYEVVQMSELKAYHTGGTIHIIINNQIGFTTNYVDARSSVYCTDVAKIIQSPIFHVNGDDVEEIIYTVNLAMEYRQRFKKDVFIDILCYRKYGHNEGDEPRYTQPLLYNAIAMHPDPYSIYKQKIAEFISNKEDVVLQMEAEFNNILEECYNQSTLIQKKEMKSFVKEIQENKNNKQADALSENILLLLAKEITTLPPDKKFLPKSIKLLDDRYKMLSENKGIDWGMAENMAYATILNAGISIRISGQDVERGTFSHRHAIVMVEDSEKKYYPLRSVERNGSSFEIYNSLLSEYAVLGFEYGYSIASPDSLVIWEAQFGDFVNGAQIIIDQYLTSAFEKWRLANNITLLLPHGYEGQGAEHSSGRIERFLNLATNNNIRVCNCSTPANYFHLLRKQANQTDKKPLIVFTPKSLLRHPACISKLEEFTESDFQVLIDDKDAHSECIDKLCLCSGKVFYDIKDKQKQLKAENIAIIRIEQLYPFPMEEIEKILDKYRNIKEIVWVQEEPSNMGAYLFVKEHIKPLNIKLIARPESASPAVGSLKTHHRQQEKIISKLFEQCDCENVCVECRMLCEIK